MSFELLKVKNTEATYGALVARVVIALLRHIRELDTEDDDMHVNFQLNSDIPLSVDMQKSNADDEDEEEMTVYQREAFVIDELFGDDDEEDDGDDTDDVNFADGDDRSSDGDDVDSRSPNPQNTFDAGQNPYPILLTLEQKRALLELDHSLRNDTSQELQLSKFHAVSLALCTTQPTDAEKSRFHHPIEFFILASNLKQDGAFKKPVSIAPNLTVLQYWIQFTIIRDAVLSEDPTSE